MTPPFNSKPTGPTPDFALKKALDLQNEGNYPDAERIYRSILAQRPNHFQALYHLGAMQINAGRLDDAMRSLRKALNQEPNASEAHAKLATVLQRLERHDEALERARRAIELNPRWAEAYAILAEVLTGLGRYDEARRALTQALELAPDWPLLYYSWGNITRWTADDPRLAALEGLSRKSQSLPLIDQINLHFALAKAHADCGAIEQSFRHQIDGGALKRRTLKYDEATILRHLGDMRSLIDLTWLREHEGQGDPSSLPLFFVGMPRSGTTLVEQILSCHPKVKTLGESPAFEQAVAQICGVPGIPPSLAQIASRWAQPELRRLGALYLQGAGRGVPSGSERIIDKALGHFPYVGLIHAALPNARVIHTTRDPADTCLSIFSILFEGSFQPYSYTLKELGRYYRAYEAMMAHWRAVLPEGTMIDVQYENVVDDLETQARRIVAFCGLEWDDACLSFYKTDRPVRTASHAQVRQPIYRSSVGRPRPPRELMLPLLEALGID